MVTAISALAVVLAVCFLAGELRKAYFAARRRAEVKKEFQARCSHQWGYFDAMDHPSFPCRRCQVCQLVQHLQQPVPCPHCGRDVRRPPNQEPRVLC